MTANGGGGEASAATIEVVLREQSLVEVAWSGHLTAGAMRALCAEVDRVVARLEDYVLLIDRTGATGYDHEAGPIAAAWARGRTAARALVTAVVTDSQLAALESPAVAMAPRRRVRLFPTRAAARAFLLRAIPTRSGEFLAPVPLPALDRSGTGE